MQHLCVLDTAELTVDEVAHAQVAPDLPKARNEATVSMYPREYNASHDTVEKARIGGLPSEQTK